MDDYAEYEPWSPYYGDSINLSKTSIGEYPPYKAHTVTCFKNSCKLAVIINDIILQLYSRGSTLDAEDTLRDTKARLDTWREQSPPHLKYDPDHLPDYCPPPHILTQK